MSSIGKIYYCRPVRLGLWETFNNKPCGNVIVTRLVGATSVRELDCSHQTCGNTFQNKVSKIQSIPTLWDTCCKYAFTCNSIGTLCTYPVGKG